MCIMCACLFSALSRRVDALQMSIIIVIITLSQAPTCTALIPVTTSNREPPEIPTSPPPPPPQTTPPATPSPIPPATVTSPPPPPLPAPRRLRRESLWKGRHSSYFLIPVTLATRSACPRAPCRPWSKLPVFVCSAHVRDRVLCGDVICCVVLFLRFFFFFFFLVLRCWWLFEAMKYVPIFALSVFSLFLRLFVRCCCCCCCCCCFLIAFVVLLVFHFYLFVCLFACLLLFWGGLVFRLVLVVYVVIRAQLH